LKSKLISTVAAIRMAITGRKLSRRRSERPARLTDSEDPAVEFEKKKSEPREMIEASLEGGHTQLPNGRVRPSPLLAEHAAENVATFLEVDSVAKRARRGRTKRELDELRTGEPFKAALALIQHLSSDSFAYLFARPVFELWTEEDLPGYLNVVEKPMDLGTVLKNTRALEYIVEREDGSLDFDDASFFLDVRRVFRNCMLYNDSKSDYYRHARRLLSHADRRFSVRPVIPPPTRRAGNGPGVPLLPALVVKDENIIPAPALKSRSVASPKQKSRPKANLPASTNPFGDVSPSRSKPGRRPASVEVALPAALHISDMATMNDGSNSRQPGLPNKPTTLLKLPNIAVTRPATNGLKSEAKKTTTTQGIISTPQKKLSKWAHTSSVSSDEQEVMVVEPVFTFVSTAGMEKKRGRKSALVQDLEVKHEQLMKRRKLLLDSAASLERRKQVQMTFEEKSALCDQVAVLDFVRMKGVVDIIARGMNRYDILSEVEVDMDIDGIDNSVLREIQAFLDNSTVVAALGTLRNVDEDLAEVEAQLVDIRYHKVS
jgi:Bromodomain/Bromodomain extra-terminal - transcription regulation